MRPVKLIVKLRSMDLEVEPEDNDTIESINAYLEGTQEHYREFYRLTRSIVGDGADIPETIEVSGGEGAGEQTAAAPAPVRRGRKPKAAPEAVAPPPIPVPDAAPPPVPAAPIDTGIPPFLDRTGTAAVAPPPPAPVAPPPVVAPPVGVLAGKVVVELKKRGEGAADAGKGLVDWLASAGMVVPGASFQEAIDCVSFLSDEKLAPVAAALQIQ